jgi:hypothetical protein
MFSLIYETIGMPQTTKNTPTIAMQKIPLINAGVIGLAERCPTIVMPLKANFCNSTSDLAKYPGPKILSYER